MEKSAAFRIHIDRGTKEMICHVESFAVVCRSCERFANQNVWFGTVAGLGDFWPPGPGRMSG
jgi:hypothetical protein